MLDQVGHYTAPTVRSITSWALPQARLGPRPKTRDVVPHQQLDQWPPREIVEQLGHCVLDLPHVYARQSRMACPETRALSLPDEFAHGPDEAFIDGSEFCHLHPPPEGSVHLTLPSPLRQLIVHVGWGEDHPMVRAGVLGTSLVMIYAPRDERELNVVARLIAISRDFAAGAF